MVVKFKQRKKLYEMSKDTGSNCQSEAEGCEYVDIGMDIGIALAVGYNILTGESLGKRILVSSGIIFISMLIGVTMCEFHSNQK